MYLPLVVSSTCHFCVTIFVELNYGRHKSTFTFFEVVKSLTWVSHVVFAAFFALIFNTRLPITIVEMLLLSNRVK